MLNKETVNQTLDKDLPIADRHRAFDDAMLYTLMSPSKTQELTTIKNAFWDELRELHRSGELKDRSDRAKFAVSALRDVRSLTNEADRESRMEEVVYAYTWVQQTEDDGQAQWAADRLLKPAIERLTEEERGLLAKDVRGQVLVGHTAVFELNGLADYLVAQTTQDSQ